MPSPCQPPTIRGGLAALLAAGILMTITHAGCGETPPPAPKQEEFQEGKQEREKIIQKEYGGAAFEKGAKGAPKK